jgi:solute carrier family 15 oligopeptide transporter 1
LAAIALGTGGIKPCVAAFGGDQFGPGQEKQLQKFFSFFYISINAGSLLSTFITPILREDVNCFGRLDCFPLAFGVPSLLMIVALGLFLLGRVLTNYKMTPPSKENIVVQVVSCVFVSYYY